MFTDIITYEDFDGNTDKMEVFFNISKMEALELEASYSDGYASMLGRIAASNNNRAILDTFKDLVKKAYGVKSEDGKRFVKSEEEFEKFVSSPAYDEFMMKLMTEEDYALDFIIGAFPNAEGVTKETILSNMNSTLPATS